MEVEEGTAAGTTAAAGPSVSTPSQWDRRLSYLGQELLRYYSGADFIYRL